MAIDPSDNVIRKGDLVMVVGPARCCDSRYSIGFTFTIKEMSMPQNVIIKQACCGAYRLSSSSDVILSNGQACQLYRLKKIKPPGVSEDCRAADKLTV